MFAVVFFLSFVSFLLILQREVAALLSVFFLVVFVFFLQRKFGVTNFKKNFLPFLLASLAGIGLALWRFPKQNVSLPEKLVQQKAQVLQVTSRSAIIELNQPKVKLRLISLPTPLVRFDTIEVSCRILPVKRNILQTLEKWQGIAAMCATETVKILSPRTSWQNFFLTLRQKISQNLQENLPPQSLASGILLADTTSMDSYELTLYRHMGIAHLFAASGLHLALIFGLFFLPFKWLRRPSWGYFFGLLAATGFLFLLETPISLVRAYIFLLFFLLGKLGDRKIAKENVLFLTASFTELLYPLSTFSLSFILSFSITGSILLFFSELQRLFIKVKFKFLADHLALTLAAFATSALLTAIFFNSSGPAVIFYNLIAVPLAAFYLTASLITSILPAAAPAVKAGDWFYQQLAYLHSQTLYAYLPPIPETWAIAWGGLVFLLFFFFWYCSYYTSHWLAKPILFYGLFILLVAFYVPLIVSPPLPRMVRVIPYMVFEYEKRMIYSHGETAAFLDKPEEVFSLPALPVKKIYLSQEKINFLPPLLQKKVLPTVSHKVTHGLIKGRFGCYLFFSALRPQNWRPSELRDCTQVFVILSAKDSKASYSDITPLLRAFQYHQEVRTLPYFTWQIVPY